MIIGGRYLSKDSIARWQRIVEPGDVPAIWTEFEFPTLRGPPERLAMWTMVDTGADLCVVPPLAMGILLPDDGSPPAFAKGSVGTRLIFKVCEGLRGINDRREPDAKMPVDLRVSARIKLAGRELQGAHEVSIGGNFDYPVIGRNILNLFAAALNPFGQRLSLSDGLCARRLASLVTRMQRPVTALLGNAVKP